VELEVELVLGLLLASVELVESCVVDAVLGLVALVVLLCD